jgi:hypothetical protein
MKSLDVDVCTHTAFVRVIDVKKSTLKGSLYIWKYLSSEKVTRDSFSEASKLEEWSGWRDIRYLLVTSCRKIRKTPKQWKSEMKASLSVCSTYLQNKSVKFKTAFIAAVPSSEPFWTWWWCIFWTSTKGCKWGFIVLLTTICFIMHGKKKNKGCVIPWPCHLHFL